MAGLLIGSTRGTCNDSDHTDMIAWQMACPDAPRSGRKSPSAFEDVVRHPGPIHRQAVAGAPMTHQHLGKYSKRRIGMG